MTWFIVGLLVGVPAGIFLSEAEFRSLLRIWADRRTIIIDGQTWRLTPHVERRQADA